LNACSGLAIPDFALVFSRRERCTQVSFTVWSSINQIEVRDRATILLDLVCDDQLAVLEIGDPEVVSRINNGAVKQRIRNFSFERQVPPFEILNVDLSRHDILQIFPFGAKCPAPHNDLDQ
jgi:hypothetical protein